MTPLDYYCVTETRRSRERTGRGDGRGRHQLAPCRQATAIVAGKFARGTRRRTNIHSSRVSATTLGHATGQTREKKGRQNAGGKALPRIRFRRRSQHATHCQPLGAFARRLTLPLRFSCSSKLPPADLRRCRSFAFQVASGVTRYYRSRLRHCESQVDHPQGRDQRN